MTIKKFTANADNTIVNSFETNMSTRATGSNTGESDIVEVYSIWARQQVKSSYEVSNNRYFFQQGFKCYTC